MSHVIEEAISSASHLPVCRDTGRRGTLGSDLANTIRPRARAREQGAARGRERGAPTEGHDRNGVRKQDRHLAVPRHRAQYCTTLHPICSTCFLYYYDHYHSCTLII